MKIQNIATYVAAVLLLSGLESGLAPARADDGGIGLYGTVEGTVTVARVGDALGRPVKLQEPVFFEDFIETQNESRTKALFDDDSILTVGENSKVRITEYVYNPNQNIRSAVVHLLEGRLRALVAKAFKGPGSKFEIHTPTAVAAARGTYFVVWSEGGKSGMVNIGEEGKVDFTAAGKTVTVSPGQYSVALPGQAPSQPAAYQPAPDPSAKSTNGTSKSDDSRQDSGVATTKGEEDGKENNNTSNKEKVSKDYMKWAHKAVTDTRVKDRLKLERPMDVLRSLRHDAGASSRVMTKVVPGQQVGRQRNDRKVKDGNDNGSGNGKDSDNSANVASNDNGRGKGDGGNEGNKGPGAKGADVLSDRGSSDMPKGDKGQSGGDGNGNGNLTANGNGIGDGPKDRGRSDGSNDGNKGGLPKLGDVLSDRGSSDMPKGDKGQGGSDGNSGGNLNANGNGSMENAKDRGRGDGNNDGPKDRNRGGDSSKFASTNLSGGGPGKIIPIAPLSTPVASAPLASPVATSPVASPVVGAPAVSAPVTSAPLAAPVAAPPVATPVVTVPVPTVPVLGAPVTPTAPAVTVMTPPAVITGAASANSGNGKGNGNGHGKNK
jgi:hypothetical protein